MGCVRTESLIDNNSKKGFSECSVEIIIYLFSSKRIDISWCNFLSKYFENKMTMNEKMNHCHQSWVCFPPKLVSSHRIIENDE